jgi:hypothetical protein
MARIADGMIIHTCIHTSKYKSPSSPELLTQRMIFLDPDVLTLALVLVIRGEDSHLFDTNLTYPI